MGERLIELKDVAKSYGRVFAVGGVNLHVTNKFVPKHPNPPPAPEYWNELLFPREFPLSFHELSYLLPHFLKEGRGRLDVYLTRVYNPLWTNPDGFSWMDVLTDADKIGLHVSLSPTWSETLRRTSSWPVPARCRLSRESPRAPDPAGPRPTGKCLVNSMTSRRRLFKWAA